MKTEYRTKTKLITFKTQNKTQGLLGKTLFHLALKALTKQNDSFLNILIDIIFNIYFINRKLIPREI